MRDSRQYSLTHNHMVFEKDFVASKQRIVFKLRQIGLVFMNQRMQNSLRFCGRKGLVTLLCFNPIALFSKGISGCADTSWSLMHRKVFVQYLPIHAEAFNPV